jgi:hypothetical protein
MEVHMKNIKTKLAVGIVTVSLAFGSLFPSASHAMRVQALDDIYGKAAKVETLSNGDEIRYFEIMSESLPIPKWQEYRVFQVKKDGVVLDKGFYKGPLDKTASDCNKRIK